MEAKGNYYLISHIVLITGLTDRTVRSYISSGILQGEMINGLWHFTPEQVDEFVRHPAVYPSIQAKHRALVNDHLLEKKRKDCEACLILDLPGDDAKTVAEYFCYRISGGNFLKVRFFFDSFSGTPRVYLSGATADVLQLANGYMQEREKK